MADYLIQNREELNKWLEQDPESFDWIPANMSCLWKEKSSKYEVKNRVVFLREKVEAHCDLAADPITMKIPMMW